MGKKDPRVDAYIARSAGFARPILKHLRKVVHAGCPDVEETIKWGFPHFMHKGILCSMASFKAHCAFGFWKRKLLEKRLKGVAKGKGPAMGDFGRLTSLSDLPSERVLIRCVREAAALNDKGSGGPTGGVRRGSASWSSRRLPAGAEKEPEGAGDLRGFQPRQQAGLRGVGDRGQEGGDPKAPPRDGHRLDGGGEGPQLEVRRELRTSA